MKNASNIVLLSSSLLFYIYVCINFSYYKTFIREIDILDIRKFEQFPFIYCTIFTLIFHIIKLIHEMDILIIRKFE